MTNYELIQEMEPWQLAEFLRKVSDGETEFTICDRKCDECANDTEMCEALIERWLKEDCENRKRKKPIELKPWRKIIIRPLSQSVGRVSWSNTTCGRKIKKYTDL